MMVVLRLKKEQNKMKKSRFTDEEKIGILELVLNADMVSCIHANATLAIC